MLTKSQCPLSPKFQRAICGENDLTLDHQSSMTKFWQVSKRKCFRFGSFENNAINCVHLKFNKQTLDLTSDSYWDKNNQRQDFLYKHSTCHFLYFTSTITESPRSPTFRCFLFLFSFRVCFLSVLSMQKFIHQLNNTSGLMRTLKQDINSNE